MKLKVVYVPGNQHNVTSHFSLVDEDTDEEVGVLYKPDGTLPPSVESMTRFQGAKIVLDGKSLKKLQRDNEQAKRDGEVAPA